MLLDARRPDEVPELLEAPVVIVGAGTVGLFLAMKLLRERVPVILVERGGRVADSSEVRQTAMSVAKQHHGVTLGRTFGLGGTSTLWGGQLAEFDEADVTTPGHEWPISFPEIRNWYADAYAFLGIEPSESLASVRQAIGDETDAGLDVDRFFTYWLPQPNFAALFRNEIATSPLLKVITHAVVDGIAFDGTGATHVLARSSDRQRALKISGHKFVFANGVIETVRFFLSLQRQGDVPWRTNRNIGAYFMDHLGGTVASVKLADEAMFRAYFENAFSGGIKLQPKLRFSKDARQKRAIGVCGIFNFQSDLDESIANLKGLVRSLRAGVEYSNVRSLPKDIWSLGSSLLPIVIRYIRDRRVLAFFDRALDLVIQAEQLPVRESAIRLADGPLHEDGLHRAVIDWRLDGRESDDIRTFVHNVDTYLKTHKIASLEIDDRVLQNPASLDQLNDTYHQCGGMCMSATASAGVTDPNGRVWETNNVFVAGSSLFPTSSHANCTLTALALAARLSRFLGRPT